MRFKIRTKLITAFLAIIFPFIILVGVIAIYKQNTIIMGIVTISDMIEERVQLEEELKKVRKL